MAKNTSGQSKSIEPSYEEALIILGLNPGHDYTFKEIDSAYNKQARKYHPDLNPQLGPEKMQIINEAMSIIKKHFEKPSPRTPDINNALKLLRSKIPYDLSLQETKRKIGLLQRKAKTPIEDLAIGDATEIFLSEREKVRYYKAYDVAKKKARMKKLIRQSVNYSTEESKVNKMIKDMDRDERMRQANKELLYKVKRIFHDEDHIPIITEHPTDKRKIIKKWIILTASLAAAILAGRYAYNHWIKAYRHKDLKPIIKGYLPAPKRKR